MEGSLIELARYRLDRAKGFIEAFRGDWFFYKGIPKNKNFGSKPCAYYKRKFALQRKIGL